ncbi:antiterminator Q family protein [Orbaceae bacterium ac157xtp]
MRSTKDILKAWKNTRVLKRMGTEYPSKSAGIEGAPRNFDYRQYLTEEEASLVDKAVLKLKEDNIEYWVVLTSLYLREISCSKQARILGKQTTEITKILLAAECFVRGHIIELFSKAA